MDRTTLTRTGIAGAVAGLGLAIGGVAVASADTQTADTSASTTAKPGGPRGERGYDAAALAKALGLKEADVKAALEAVRDELRPEEPSSTEAKPTPPTEAERAERQAAFVAALAKELGVSEAKVKTAVAAQEEKLEAAREEQRAESRADLVTRLDAAVEDGTLTAADKASVLKAFDAKILGGGPGGHGGGPGGGGRPAN